MVDLTDADDCWVVTRAVVRGTGHIKLGTPCQDHCDIRLSRDGRWLVAAVCDGAGSAKRSDEGAKLVSEGITRGLINEIANFERHGPGVWVKDRVHALLLDARQQLRHKGGEMHDFACTLVGALVGPTGGFFFHVGDGAGVSSRAVITRDGHEQLFLWDSITISPPENGEVANETFFVTQDDWDKHLRSMPIPRTADLVMLMSDGGMEFVLPRQQINPSWVTPVVGELMRTQDEDVRCRLVHNYLEDPAAQPITSDDKTLLVAMRQRLVTQAGRRLSMDIPAVRSPAVPARPWEESVIQQQPEVRTAARDAGRHPAVSPFERRPMPVVERQDARPTIALALSGLAFLLSLAAALLGVWNYNSIREALATLPVPTAVRVQQDEPPSAQNPPLHVEPDPPVPTAPPSGKTE